MARPIPTILLLACLAACARSAGDEIELLHFPADDLHDIVSVSMVLIDARESSDGRASLVVQADRPTVIRLYETGDLDVEAAQLIYRAMLKTEELEGEAYLEMWVRVPGKGESVSRALHQPLTGTTGWTSQETRFSLKEGENPDNIRLNLVVNGTGIVWIDDIHLNKKRAAEPPPPVEGVSAPVLYWRTAYRFPPGEAAGAERPSR